MKDLIVSLINLVSVVPWQLAGRLFIFASLFVREQPLKHTFAEQSLNQLYESGIFAEKLQSFPFGTT